jgi:hypothetical protein
VITVDQALGWCLAALVICIIVEALRWLWAK